MVAINTWVSRIVQSAKEKTLRQLVPLFVYLAGRVHKYRQTHNGFVPPEIFPSLASLGGVYPCVEVVVRHVDKEGNVLGYFLKKRTDKELGWNGQYQIIGCAVRTTDNETDALARLSEELYGGEGDPTRLAEAEILGQETHLEPERRAVCQTLVYRIDVGNISQLDGGPKQWRSVAIDELQQPKPGIRVINHHKHTLAWADDENRPFVADLRGGYLPTKWFVVGFNVYAGAQNQGTYRTVKVRAASAEAARLMAGRYANQVQYRQQGDRDDFWSFEVDSVRELMVPVVSAVR